MLHYVVTITGLTTSHNGFTLLYVQSNYQEEDDFTFRGTDSIFSLGCSFERLMNKAEYTASLHVACPVMEGVRRPLHQADGTELSGPPEPSVGSKQQSARRLSWQNSLPNGAGGRRCCLGGLPRQPQHASRARLGSCRSGESGDVWSGPQKWFSPVLSR